MMSVSAVQIVRVSVYTQDEATALARSLLEYSSGLVLIVECNYQPEAGFLCRATEMLQQLHLAALVIIADDMVTRWKFQLVVLLAQVPYPIQVISHDDEMATLTRLGTVASI